jgi:hypothetical protein
MRTEIKKTDQLLIKMADGTYDTNKFGEYRSFIAEVTTDHRNYYQSSVFMAEDEEAEKRALIEILDIIKAQFCK